MPAPSKYNAEFQQRAIRLYRERLEEGNISCRAARDEIAKLVDCHSSTVKNWISAANKADQAPSVNPTNPQELAKRLRELERENSRLRQANDILKAASAFFAAAELDRRGASSSISLTPTASSLE